MKQQHKDRISTGLRRHHSAKRVRSKLRLIITSIQIFLVLFIGAHAVKLYAQFEEMTAEHYQDTEYPVPEMYEVMEGNDYAHLMVEISEEYGVDYDVMQAIADCESNFIPDTQSFYITDTGERENSWGIIQINKDYHDVTIEQATDPEFALRWYANEVKEGRLWQWSCAYILDIL